MGKAPTPRCYSSVDDGSGLPEVSVGDLFGGKEDDGMVEGKQAVELVVIEEDKVVIEPPLLTQLQPTADVTISVLAGLQQYNEAFAVAREFGKTIAQAQIIASRAQSMTSEQFSAWLSAFRAEQITIATAIVPPAVVVITTLVPEEPAPALSVDDQAAILSDFDMGVESGLIGGSAGITADSLALPEDEESRAFNSVFEI